MHSIALRITFPMVCLDTSFVLVCVCYPLLYRMGKTTLLNHIAERKLTIPPNIDVLLCEQEVVADDTPAFNAVLNADKKRLALLDEEVALMAAGEAGDDSGSDRLQQVSDCVKTVHVDTLLVHRYMWSWMPLGHTLPRRVLDGSWLVWGSLWRCSHEPHASSQEDGE